MMKLSFLNLFRRKTRTLLSVFGIAIGVAAIIVLVSVVDGFTLQFDSVIGQYKGITVYEKDAQGQVFSKVDASFEQKIEGMPGVKAAIPEIWVSPKKIDEKDIGLDSFSPPSVYGLDIGKYFSTNAKGWVGDVEKGLPLKSSDSGQVLIGKKIGKDFHKFVGAPIKIDGKAFKVKGILAGESDFIQNMVVMNLWDARSISPLDSGKITSLTVTLNDVSQDKKVAGLIKLMYGEKLQAFTQAELSEQFTGIIGNLRLLAIVVALISSIVAGIGIANTMLMSVLERFGEIGALKAVGWTNGNILSMILFESLFLGAFGGFAGLTLGVLVDQILASGGVDYYISPVLAISSFLFAVLLGVFAGIYPAYHASRLDPVEALRR